MKTIIRICCAFCFFLFCVSLSAQEKKVPKEMLGKWLCTLDNPQGGPMSGTCTIFEKDGVTKATLDMGFGATESSAFKALDNGKFDAGIDVQGYNLGLIFDYKDNNLSCDLDAGGFLIPMEMKRE